MATIRNYDNLTPCEFFDRPQVKRCLIRFIKKYGGGSNSLTSVATQDSATVTWSGTGTSGDPLIATVQGEITAPPSIAIIATDSGGNLIDGTANVITRPLTGFVTDGNTAITASDTILVAFTKAQGQIDARISLTSPITGFAVGANSTMLAADTLLAALGKVQGQINARITTATVLSAFTVGANATVANTDNIITALGKIQGQINARALSTSIPTAANPTGTISTTASNGVATTFMRSDAAPAINLAITPTWTGVHTFNGANTLFGGNINVQGNISSGANTQPASPTNSGVALVGNPNNADIVMFDSTRAVNNRTAEMIFFQGAQQFRFKNDAGSTAITWLAASGGQASNITGITSNSGTGAWVHTGNMSVSGDLTQSAAVFNKSRVDATLAITIAATDYIVILTDATAGTGTIALPDPALAANNNRTLVITNAGTSNFTTDRPYISNNDPADTTVSSNTSITLHATGNNWYQIA